VPRYCPAPPPEPADLLVLPLHVLVREWPELDPPLREAGLDLGPAGHLLLGDALASRSVPGEESGAGGGDGEGRTDGLRVVMDRMVAATRWRFDPPS